MSPLDDIAGRLPPSRIAALGAMATILPLAGTIAAQGVVDVVLIGTAVVGATGSAAVWLRRRRLETLPLELGRHAVRDEIDGVPVVKVRARLGRGRQAHDPVVEVTYRTDDGEETLPAVLPVTRVCGAFTVTALDRDRITAAPGTLRVRLRVGGSGRTWEAERSFTTLRSGRFLPPVVRRRGALAHDRDRWDALQEAAAEE